MIAGSFLEQGKAMDRGRGWTFRWPAAAMAWLLTIVAGLGALHGYESTPGAVGRVSMDWPEGSSLKLEEGGRKGNLLMFAHPRCPCTQASLEELGLILERFGSDLPTRVVFFQPERADEGWQGNESRRRVGLMKGARIVDDVEGHEAARFGAETSGHVMLYDNAGRLVFSGGITGARGRVGENPGVRALIARLSGSPSERTSSPTYGCLIREEGRVERVLTP